MNTELYPLKFDTIYKEKLWGGEKISTVLGKDFSPLPNCGETWEVSGVKGNVSVVTEGALKGQPLTALIEQFGSQLLGGQVADRFGKEFPLLIKFIDANDDLSIQVHPDDQLAKERHDSFGKTEMWYIFQADEGAQLISGFNQTVSQAQYLEHLNAKTLDQILNYEQVQAGDVFFMPAGRVHSIGKGCLLAEIQQTSDVTYRIYDFDRKDADGNTRELHTELALEAIDYQHYPSYKTQYQPQPNHAVELASCQYFETNLIQASTATARDYSQLDSFVIYICFEGSLTLKCRSGEYAIKKGEAVLLPATLQQAELLPNGNFGLLETYIPKV